jgi:hypothetical protein
MKPRQKRLIFLDSFYALREEGFGHKAYRNILRLQYDVSFGQSRSPDLPSLFQFIL